MSLSMFFHAPTNDALAKRLVQNLETKHQAQRISSLSDASFVHARQPDILDKDTATIKDLLETPWFKHTKENFSWLEMIPMPSMFTHPEPIELIELIEMQRGKRLSESAFKLNAATEIQKQLAANNTAILIDELKSLKQRLDHRDSTWAELKTALSKIVTMPFAFVIGAVALLPAYAFEWSYFGTAAFLMDAAQCFVESLWTLTQYILTPLAMIHAYCTSGSADIFNKGECERIVDTLLERLKSLKFKAVSEQPLMLDDSDDNHSDEEDDNTQIYEI